MKAMGFRKTAPVEESPLETVELPEPILTSREVKVKVHTCGVCLTDRHQVEGDLPQKYTPTIPGHQIVGKVVEKGRAVTRFREGDRVGISWLYSACGKCPFCLTGNENLCYQAKFTGWDTHGGYSEYIIVNQDFAYHLPKIFSDSQAAPLLCAGVIGYRSLRLSGAKPGQTLGLFGFGASAQIVTHVAKYLGCRVYVFTRGGEHRRIAESLGADWTGLPQDPAPSKLDSAITFAPAEDTVLCALEALERGGRLIINAISMQPRREKEFNYGKQLWWEKEVKSVANVTRRDAEDFLALAAKVTILPEVQEFDLKKANQALLLHKQGRVKGSAVLRVAD